MARSAFFTMSLMALAACGGPNADLPVEEARGVLEDFARGSAPADACTPEGRDLLRSATRSYSRAMAERGEPWPDIIKLSNDGGEGITDIDVMVLAGVGAGFIEPSDLNGPARQYTQLMTLGGYNTELFNMQRAVRDACHEVLALQQATARYAIDFERYERAAQRAGERGESASDLHRRQERMLRAQRHLQRLAEAVQAKMEDSAER
ncbi:MAG: hypothetical protein WDM79_05485 [Terricaulis sp.]